MSRKQRPFKEGDKVVLNPLEVSEEDLRSYGSSGRFGVVYTISCINKDDPLDVHLGGSNWHKSGWLSFKAAPKNIIGGKVV